MDLRGYLGVIWRRRWLPILAVLIGAGAVWFVGPPVAPDTATYRVTATLNVNDDAVGSSVLLYSHVANETRQYHELVAAELGPSVYDDANTVDVLVSTMTITAVPEIGTLTLTADEQPSEETARLVVATFGEQIIADATQRQVQERDENLGTLEIRERELEDRINLLETQLEGLRAQQTEEQRAEGRSPDRVLEIQLGAAISSLNQVLAERDALRALTDDDLTPLGFIGNPTVEANEIPQPPLGFTARLLVSVVLSLLLGIGLVFLLHRFDTRIFERKDAEGAFQLPVLAGVRRVGWLKRRNFQIVTRVDPKADASQSYRLLRTNIAQALSTSRVDASHRIGGDVIAVTSVSAAVGKSTTVANLAVALVDAGQSVLVVGGDLREPTLHQFFSVTPRAGLVEAAAKIRAGAAPADLVDEFVVATDVPGVYLLPHGSEVETVASPGETLAVVRPLIEACQARFDVVLLDTPPMLAGNDVGELVLAVDLVVLVARASRSTIEEGEWAIETAGRLQAPVCGLVLIGARSQLERKGGRRGSLPRRILGAVLRRFRSGRTATSTGDETVPAQDVPVPRPAPAPGASVPVSSPAVPAEAIPAAAPTVPATPVQQPVVPGAAPTPAAPAATTPAATTPAASTTPPGTSLAAATEPVPTSDGSGTGSSPGPASVPQQAPAAPEMVSPQPDPIAEPQPAATTATPPANDPAVSTPAAATPPTPPPDNALDPGVVVVDNSADSSADEGQRDATVALRLPRLPSSADDSGRSKSGGGLSGTEGTKPKLVVLPPSGPVDVDALLPADHGGGDQHATKGDGKNGNGASTASSSAEQAAPSTSAASTTPDQRDHLQDSLGELVDEDEIGPPRSVGA